MKLAHARHPLFALSALLIVASMALAACGAPAAEAPAAEPAAPAATEAPATEAPAPVATEAPATEAPQPEPGEILLSDTFDNNDNEWGTFEEDGYSAQIQDGQMVMKLTKADYHAISYPKGSNVSNVDMSFDVVHQEGTQNNTTFGAYCRYSDDDNLYAFSMTDGWYAMAKAINGEIEMLVEWTESTAILGMGETNHFRVVCSGSALKLYANDQLLISKQDESLTAGGFALNASRYEEDDKTVVVAFDNVEANVPLVSELPVENPISDSFDNNDNEWGLFKEDGYSVQIQDGQMVMKFMEPDYYSYSMPKGDNFSNVDISFDAVLQEGAQDNAWFGAMCRYTDENNYYDFSVDGDGYYDLWKVVNGETEKIIDWTESTAIKPGIGETNRIRVVCSDSDLELYANDQLVFSKQDTSLTAGTFSLQAGRYDEDAALVSVAFDNLEVKVP
jgi:hypothetical protein